jgi:hypothetical protein
MNNVRKKWIPLANWGVVSGFKGGALQVNGPRNGTRKAQERRKKNPPKGG